MAIMHQAGRHMRRRIPLAEHIRWLFGRVTVDVAGKPVVLTTRQYSTLVSMLCDGMGAARRFLTVADDWMDDATYYRYRDLFYESSYIGDIVKVRYPTIHGV